MTSCAKPDGCRAELNSGYRWRELPQLRCVCRDKIIFVANDVWSRLCRDTDLDKLLSPQKLYQVWRHKNYKSIIICVSRLCRVQDLNKRLKPQKWYHFVASQKVRSSPFVKLGHTCTTSYLRVAYYGVR